MMTTHEIEFRMTTRDDPAWKLLEQLRIPLGPDDEAEDHFELDGDSAAGTTMKITPFGLTVFSFLAPTFQESGRSFPEAMTSANRIARVLWTLLSVVRSHGTGRTGDTFTDAEVSLAMGAAHGFWNETVLKAGPEATATLAPVIRMGNRMGHLISRECDREDEAPVRLAFGGRAAPGSA